MVFDSTNVSFFDSAIARHTHWIRFLLTTSLLHSSYYAPIGQSLPSLVHPSCINCASSLSRLDSTQPSLSFALPKSNHGRGTRARIHWLIKKMVGQSDCVPSILMCIWVDFVSIWLKIFYEKLSIFLKIYLLFFGLHSFVPFLCPS